MGKPSRINKPAKGHSPPQNPYRAILRREYPEPLIALLAFIMGIWLWDHYFGEKMGYQPGTEEVALVKIDRDLRLADAMEDDPAWLRWLAGVDTPETVKRRAVESLKKLALEQAIGPPGLEAYAVIRSQTDGSPLLRNVVESLRGEVISSYDSTSTSLAEHRGSWWHAKMAEAWEVGRRQLTPWRNVYEKDSIQLRTRAIFAGSSVWLLGLLGLAFLPAALRRLAGAVPAKPRNYGGAWTPSLGLVIFMCATLAWIGFGMTVDIGLATLTGMHPLLGILIDTSARLLPAAIAIGLLFRRPSHAVRILGFNQPLYLGTVLGVFCLLIWADQILRGITGYFVSTEPGGGLNSGDAGPWGLAFAVVSACIVAPLAEEILYRGVLFRSFWNRLGVLPAAILSSGIFAILHFYDGYGLASVGIFGFSCALLYAATGSLTSVVALHMLYNSAIKIPEWIVYHAPLG